MRKKSITYKYLQVFMLLIVFPILVISWVMGEMFTNILLKNTSENMLQSMEQFSKEINNQVDKIAISAATISNDKEIILLLNEYRLTKDSYMKNAIHNKLLSKLNFLFD